MMRVSPAGEGFVLYQMAKREVTALAIGPKNEIYAAALGNKGPCLRTQHLPGRLGLRRCRRVRLRAACRSRTTGLPQR